MLTLKISLLKLLLQTAKGIGEPACLLCIFPTSFLTFFVYAALISYLKIKFRKKMQPREHQTHNLTVRRFLACPWAQIARLPHSDNAGEMGQSGQHGLALVTPPTRPSNVVKQPCKSSTGGRVEELMQSLLPLPSIYWEASTSASWAHLKQPVLKDGPRLMQ